MVSVIYQERIGALDSRKASSWMVIWWFTVIVRFSKSIFSQVRPQGSAMRRPQGSCNLKDCPLLIRYCDFRRCKYLPRSIVFVERFGKYGLCFFLCPKTAFFLFLPFTVHFSKVKIIRPCGAAFSYSSIHKKNSTSFLYFSSRNMLYFDWFFVLHIP